MAIELNLLGTTEAFGEGAAEIPAYDPTSGRLFVVNAENDSIDVFDLSDPAAPTLITSIVLPSGSPNSVAVRNGLVAIAVEADPSTDPGLVLFYDAQTLTELNQVTVGALPDMLTFTPDGSTVLVANEGEPDTIENPDGSETLVDPEGSVSIINLSRGVERARVRTASFRRFNRQAEEFIESGVRIFPDALLSQDVEPEYIAVSEDGKTAFVTLQENNSVAVLDIRSGRITNIIPLGLKDHSLDGNGLDASDEDGGVNIQNWPVLGMYMPDAIASYTVDGKTYYVTANEGDSRDEDERIEDLTLDPTAFPNAAELQLEENLGRLEASTIDGDTDGDGDFDQLYVYGGRSFSIWDEDGNLVFDSGDDFEQILATQFPDFFVDGRSDNKGPEPEGVVVGQVGDSTYAFIGLERANGVMVYDVTDPVSPEFQQFIATEGDVSPEGLAFVTSEDSPNGTPLLIVSNEVSGTTSIYEIEETTGEPEPPSDDTFTLQILHASDLEGGVDAVGRAPNFAAIVDFLEDDASAGFDASITLSAGDNYIPGPFFNAAGDQSAFRDSGLFNAIYNALFGLPDGSTAAYDALREGGGRVDISIMNLIGFDASAIGNHEFDFGSDAFESIIEPDFRDPLGPESDRWVGAQFPYLSANLDFSGDADLGNLFTSEILLNTAFQTGPDASLSGTTTPKIAPATIIEEGGEQIGVIGATTQLLESVSTPTGTTVIGNPGANDMAQLASVLQPVVDQLRDQGINKIILVSHLQQIALETELAGLLDGVDVIIAGGSDTLLADDTDVLRTGDTADGNYPITTTDASGNPVLIVSTDGEYSYVGRLVVEFDAEGHVIPSSVDAAVSGAYATTDEIVEDLWGSLDAAFADGTKGEEVEDLVEAVSGVVEAQDGNVFGETTVFLDGNRESVRTEETNMGNLTADANLFIAQQLDDMVLVSIKNGGGIRAPIGEVDSVTGELLPPQGNPTVGKEIGEISQLDIDNSLRFNNGLTLLTLTPEQLLQVLEHSVAATEDGATPGQFPQVGGVSFSFDPDLDVGSRVQSVALVTDSGIIPVVENGEVLDGAPDAIRIVTLNFLANGGDDYPFADFVAADPAFANRVDVLGETNLGDNGAFDPFDADEDLNLNGIQDDPIAEPFDGVADFSPFGGEQDALAEYLAANFPVDGSTPFSDAETDPAEDTRIQNLDFRQDTVLDGSSGGGSEPNLVISEVMYNPASTEDDWEWVEIFNAGDSTVDLSGYVLDDINTVSLGAANIASGLVAAGETAVLYNADDVAIADFEAAWGTGINLVAVSDWSALQLNNGGDQVSLWSSFDDYQGDHEIHANAIATVNYDDASPWPTDDNSASIYLTDLSADVNEGSNWALSEIGTETPAGGAGYQSAAAAGNSGSDVASPGGTLNGGGDPLDVRIYEIQGETHISDLLGELVRTSGIVTAVDSNGFYLQDAAGDDNDATSDAIFVFTDSEPGVSVGDEVQVRGSVSEFIPGGESTNNLSITQIVSPTLDILSTNNALPAAVILGSAGRIPPTEIIDNDNFAVFDPAEDGIDFYESVEGMRVTIQDAVAVSGTSRFGEIFAVAGGTTPTGLSDRGTINISPDDFNPERIQIDDDFTLSPQATPLVNTGDTLGDVTGVVSYSFGNYEVLATELFTPTAGGLQPESTTLAGSDSQLTVASYNVLNLDPNDDDGDADVANGRFGAIAEHIANNLLLPDVIALQEIQDNDGSVDSDITAADQTLQLLIDEIYAISGIRYEFIDNPFIGDDTSGGQPGGNIRTAYLYNPERVELVDGSVQTVTDPIDQQTSEDNPFFDTRLPLAATFLFDGQEVTLVNNHFSSKGGSSPLFGQIQPSVDLQEDPAVNSGVDERLAQAGLVKDFVDDILMADPNSNVVVLGDLNEFEFISPVELLAESLNNLTNTLPEDERYSFIFDGNSQSLDHILVSDSLLAGAEFDAVHLNSEFASTDERASDHDPLLVRLAIATPVNVIDGTRRRDILVGTEGADRITGFRGPDQLTGNGGADQFVYTTTREGVDTITDFEVGMDQIVLTQLLDGIGYTGMDAIADGVVTFSAVGADAAVAIDRDGLGRRQPRGPLVIVENVSVEALSNAGNFVL